MMVVQVQLLWVHAVACTPAFVQGVTPGWLSVAGQCLPCHASRGHRARWAGALKRGSAALSLWHGMVWCGAVCVSLW